MKMVWTLEDTNLNPKTKAVYGRHRTTKVHWADAIGAALEQAEIPQGGNDPTTTKTMRTKVTKAYDFEITVARDLIELADLYRFNWPTEKTDSGWAMPTGPRGQGQAHAFKNVRQQGVPDYKFQPRLNQLLGDISLVVRERYKPKDGRWSLRKGDDPENTGIVVVKLSDPTGGPSYQQLEFFYRKELKGREGARQWPTSFYHWRMYYKK
jgi:hypothetical protein